MEIKNLSPRCFHVTLGQTESRFLNELAFASHCEPEKVLADLTFYILTDRHAKMRFDEIMRTRDNYWDV